MKKVFALILILALSVSMASVLVACNKNNVPAGDFVVPEEGYDGKNVTIKFYSSMGQNYKAILQDYLDQFADMYPNITVEHTPIGDYDAVRDQIGTELKNGQTPNLAFCYGDHVAYYNDSKKVVKMDSLIDSKIKTVDNNGKEGILGLTDEEKADFREVYYNEGKSFGNDAMYMLPFAKSTELMYINQTFFTKNNIEVPDHWFATDNKEGTKSADKTSMEYVLARIKELDSHCVPLGYDAGDNWLITLFEQYQSGYTIAIGTDHYLFDNETNWKLLQTLRRWYKNGWFTTKSLLKGTYTSTYFSALDSSDNKKCYISIGSSAGAAKQLPTKPDGKNYAFEISVHMIPQKDPEHPKVISQGPSICLFKSANPQEVVASWLLLKFLVTNTEFQARYGGEAGYLPVIKSVSDNPVYKAKLDKADCGDNIAGMAAKKCVEFEQMGAFFLSPTFSGSANAREQMDVLLNGCVMVKGSSDEDILNKIKAEFKKCIEECEYSG